MKKLAQGTSDSGACLCLVLFISSALPTPMPHSLGSQSDLSKTQIKQYSFFAYDFPAVTAWFSNLHGYKKHPGKLLSTHDWGPHSMTPILYVSGGVQIWYLISGPGYSHTVA